MKNSYITIIVVGALVSFFLALPTPPGKAHTARVTIISGAQVFDGETWLGQQDVAFKDGLIIDVATDLASKYTKPLIVDGSNKYLIPGLIDAHTHAWDNALNQAAKFGVTTELDMFTNNVFAISQREKRNNHTKDLQQADLFSAGTLVTAPKGHGTEYGFTIDTITHSAQALEFVDARIEEGSDYIKIVYDVRQDSMPSIDKATLTAVIQASHHRGKLAVVHIGDAQSARDAVNAGADGLVHGFMDKQDLTLLSQQMVENNQFIVPTLSILASMTGQQRGAKLVESFNSQPRFNATELTSQLTSIRRSNNLQAFEQAKRHVATLAKAGVLILAGTDAPNPGTAHGISLHSELELLVESGLSNNQALMAATSNAAKAFSLPLRGYIKPLMKADFILLDKDPTQDITHTRSIVAVYKNGYEISYQASENAEQLSQSTLLGDFNNDTESSLATTWQGTTDKRFGGASTITLSRANVDKKSYLHMFGSLKKKFSYPWAGAFLPLSANNETPIDLTNMTSVSFDSRGTPGDYKLMLFSIKQPMRPIEVKFKVASTWQQQRISLQSVSPILLGSITGMAIVANTPSEQFELMIDDVWLNHD